MPKAWLFYYSPKNMLHYTIGQFYSWLTTAAVLRIPGIIVELTKFAVKFLCLLLYQFSKPRKNENIFRTNSFFSVGRFLFTCPFCERLLTNVLWEKQKKIASILPRERNDLKNANQNTKNSLAPFVRGNISGNY